MKSEKVDNTIFHMYYGQEGTSAVQYHPGRKKPWAARWYGRYSVTTDKQKRHCKSFFTEEEACDFIAKKRDPRKRENDVEYDYKGFYDFIDSKDDHAAFEFLNNKNIYEKHRSYIKDKFNINSNRFKLLMEIREKGEDIYLRLAEGTISFEQAIGTIRKGGKKEKVYFIQDISSKRIKIGMTTGLVGHRRKNIATMSSIPDILETLLVIEDEQEKNLHKRFGRHRVKNRNGDFHGEWFEPAQEILDYIEEHKLEK